MEEVTFCGERGPGDRPRQISPGSRNATREKSFGMRISLIPLGGGLDGKGGSSIDRMAGCWLVKLECREKGKLWWALEIQVGGNEVSPRDGSRIEGGGGGHFYINRVEFAN